MFPLVFLSSPERILSKVDLPLPLGPKITTICPFLTSKLISFKTIFLILSFLYILLKLDTFKKLVKEYSEDNF